MARPTWADLPLRPEHVELLKGAAISPAVVADVGVHSVKHGLVFPWHRPGGTVVEQLRPDQPDPPERKYVFPSGAGTPLSIVGDPSAPVALVVEGTKQSLAIASHRPPDTFVLGIAGCQSFSEEGVPVPGLAVLEGKQVVVFIDADVSTNRNVHNAASRLQQACITYGARGVVHVVDTGASAKAGIDDLLGAMPDRLRAGAVRRLIDGAGKLPRPPAKKARRPDTKPAPKPVELLRDERGDHLLGLVENLLQRYVVMGEHERVAVVLWVAHTHAVEAADITPYVAVTSAVMRAGKSNLMTLCGCLAPSPLASANATAAVLYRTIDDDPATTLFLDEVDAWLTGRNGSESAEAIRGILNAGFERGGRASRMEGQGAAMQVRHYSVFCPKMVAGIGTLPATVMDRSVPIRMKRKHRGEPVERFRRQKVRDEAEPLRPRLASWTARRVGSLANARPDLPDALDDRAQDMWEPLLAIADAAGGSWPARARAAALALSAGRGAEDGSEPERLLADIFTVFSDSGHRLPSSVMCDRLNAIEEGPWGGKRRGEGLDPRGLAKLLRGFDIVPGNIRLPDGKTPKGYRREQFLDAWSRHLPDDDEGPADSPKPPSTPSDSPANATPPHPSAHAGSGRGGQVPSEDHPPRPEPSPHTGCGGVADRGPSEGVRGTNGDGRKPSLAQARATLKDFFGPVEDVTDEAADDERAAEFVRRWNGRAHQVAREAETKKEREFSEGGAEPDVAEDEQYVRRFHERHEPLFGEGA